MSGFGVICNCCDVEGDTPVCGNAKLYLDSGVFTNTVKSSLGLTFPRNVPHGISWDGTNTPVSDVGSDELLLYSGQFSSTLKDSEDVSAITTSPTGISWDGTNTPWSNNNGTTGGKLMLTSGQFTSTIKDSQAITVSSTSALTGISYSDGNTPCSTFGATDKLFLMSGQFTSTVKDSLTSAISLDVSWDGQDTPWSEDSRKKMLTSGQFTSTLKTSLVNTNIPFGNTQEGINSTKLTVG